MIYKEVGSLARARRGNAQVRVAEELAALSQPTKINAMFVHCGDWKFVT